MFIMHDSRYSQLRLANKHSHCMMKWTTLSEACPHANAKGDVGIQSGQMLVVLIQKLLSTLTMGIECVSEYAGYQPSHEPIIECG
jgi:hypothetical protein